MIDAEKIDDSIIKRDFIKNYRQHVPQVDDENQCIKLFFGENPDYKQVGCEYLEFEMKNRKVDNTNFFVADDNTNEVIRLVSNASAFTLKGARISTSA